MPNVTPFQQDLRQLAVGLLYMNLGRAAPWFPTTTRAHPSYMVQVALTPVGDPVRDPYRRLFPFQVPWYLWQQVIVPVYEDGSGLVRVIREKAPSLRHQINQIRLHADIEDLLVSIERLILSQMEDQGLLPPSSLTTGYVASEDGPLVYKRDSELLADQQAASAAQTAYNAWVASVSTEDPLQGIWLRINGSVSEPSAAPVLPDPSYPYQENVVAEVSAPEAPGEPVVRSGTVSLVYQQFDS